jgi:iron complex transport system substrate-binding protein
MTKIHTYFILLLFIFEICSCSPKQENTNKKDTQLADNKQVISKTPLKYAVGFEVQYFENYKIATTKNTSQKRTYILVKEGQKAPKDYPNAEIIHLPVKNIVALSTKYAAFLDLLEETDKISGFSGAKYLSNPELVKRFETGNLQEVGLQNTMGLNLELILDLNPQIMMAYTMDMDGTAVFSKLKEAGISTVLFSEHLETHPLGQAEWLKFVALFFDKEEEAERIFTNIEQDYQAIKTLTENQKEGDKKTVFINIPYKDIWYMPSAKSFIAQYIKDAGGKYLWDTDSSTTVLNLNFESVFDKAKNADYWLNVSNLQTKEQVLGLNENFSNFNAFQEGNMFAYTKRSSDKGSNDYFETGVVRPDLILRDLVQILQPDLLVNDSLFFYQKIE